jgi:hypothetical protein
MAQTLINAVVSKALFDTQIETIESLRTFLATKEDTDMDFMNELLNEFKAKVESEYKPPKGAAKALKEAGQTETKAKKAKKAAAAASDSGDEKPKKLSAYTLFIKDRMTSDEFKAQYPDAKGKELMTHAVAAWSALPDSVKEAMKKLNKEDPSLSGAELMSKSSSKSTSDESEAKPEAAEPEVTKPAKKAPAKRASKKNAKKDAPKDTSSDTELEAESVSDQE